VALNPRERCELPTVYRTSRAQTVPAVRGCPRHALVHKARDFRLVAKIRGCHTALIPLRFCGKQPMESLARTPVLHLPRGKDAAALLQPFATAAADMKGCLHQECPRYRSTIVASGVASTRTTASQQGSTSHGYAMHRPLLVSGVRVKLSLAGEEKHRLFSRCTGVSSMRRFMRSRDHGKDRLKTLVSVSEEITIVSRIARPMVMSMQAPNRSPAWLDLLGSLLQNGVLQVGWGNGEH